MRDAQARDLSVHALLELLGHIDSQIAVRPQVGLGHRHRLVLDGILPDAVNDIDGGKIVRDVIIVGVFGNARYQHSRRVRRKVFTHDVGVVDSDHLLRLRINGLRIRRRKGGTRTEKNDAERYRDCVVILNEMKEISHNSIITRPMMSACWTAPKVRESELFERLSPRTR